MPVLSTNVNVPSTQGDTFYFSERVISLQNTVALFEQLTSVPPEGWVVISRPLAQGGSLVSDPIPAGVYKINSNWQYITYDQDSNSYARWTYKARPILDLMVEEQETWWSSEVLERITEWFPQWSFSKFGYWKLVSSETGLIEVPYVPIGIGAAEARGGNGTNGKKSLLPWLAIAAVAAKVLL